MNDDEARAWLDGVWRESLERDREDADPEVDRLTNSSIVSVRYALVTQLLGKIADPKRHILKLQLAAAGDGAWDARSFSTAVVVPWVADNHGILGSSAEPYASKPLRRPRLTEDMDNVRSKREWNALVQFLSPLELAPAEELRSAFLRVLGSLARKMKRQSFSYPIPRRLSQAQLQDMLARFLAVRSGGLRPLAVAAALFRVVGEGFSLFTRVESQGVNSPDSASGAPGDIMCFFDDEVRLVVEVKEAAVSVNQVQASSRKAMEVEAGLTNLLFAAPSLRERDRDEIAAFADQRWASGLNVYTRDILGLAHFAFALLPEEWRVTFVRAVCDELDRRMDHSARTAWYELLSELVGGRR